tara:strand:- start:454 stop:933 length:480 start_codon:yes stop_codon:yes gene_type:complete
VKPIHQDDYNAIGYQHDQVTGRINDMLIELQNHSYATGVERGKALAKADAPNITALQKQAATEQQIQRACGSLPDGWTIRIELENGAGYAVLYNPQGGTTDLDTAGESIAEQVSAATDFAIATANGETPNTSCKGNCQTWIGNRTTGHIQCADCGRPKP